MNWINRLIKFSLNNRLAILLCALLLIVGGVYSSRNMDVDVFPDLTAPTVVIMTDAKGMAAEEVERLVSFPIETAINGAADVRRVRSSSMQGYSFVWAEFDWGTDVYRARQTISEKMVSLAGTLPEGITPVLSPQSSVMGEIMYLGLQADSTSMMDLHTIAEWVVKPAILATGGVSQVSVIGGDTRQFRILADPRKMEAYGVSMADIERVGATFSENSVGGVLRNHGNEYAVRGIGRSADVDELGSSLVKYADGRPVLLSDVADVVIAPEQKMGYGSRNALPAVIISVSKQPGVNTLEVTDKIVTSLDDIAATLPPDVTVDTHIFRQADFISTSVDNVGRALLEGAIFVIVVLFLFLNSFRTTIISVIAIPLSLLGTMIVLHLMGMDINTMTLGGMCIAIGSLVDDAIIDVENVYKRLRENRKLPPEQRENTMKVVYEASKEIRSSILNATFIIIVAFVPLFFLSGMEGRMLKPLGIAYIIALFMSLLVAMTVTPLLCHMILADNKYLSKKRKDGWLSTRLTSWYSKALARVFRHKKAVVGTTMGLLVAAIALVFFMGRSFLPEFNEGSATIAAVTAPGTDLEVNNQLGNVIEQELLKIPEVVATARRTGRGELDEHSQSTNSAEIEVQLRFGDRGRDEVFDDMRTKLAGIPGVAYSIGQPLGHRIDHMMSGTRAAIAIKIFGPELGVLKMTGNSVKAAIDDIPGVVDVQVEQQSMTPQIQIRPDRAALAARGISMEDFNRFVSLAFAGERIGEIYEGQRAFDVILRLNSDYTGSIEGIRDALIDTGDGGKVPLSQVAEIVSSSGPNTISRENVQRKLVVSANVSGRDAGSAVDAIREAISEKVQLPEGYRIEYGGQFESAESASRTLMWTILGALVVIFLLLLGEFKNVWLVVIVLVTLPLALIGGVMAVYISSGVISIPSMIGFITLFGVATRNGILLISRYRHLQAEGKDLEETVTEGSADRLNPILMTALTSALALIPLVLSGDKAGNEIQSPMAIVVLGGLLTSTVLNIFILPVIYHWHMSRKHVKKTQTVTDNRES